MLDTFNEYLYKAMTKVGSGGKKALKYFVQHN
jgi:hypothetical protein